MKCMLFIHMFDTFVDLWCRGRFFYVEITGEQKFTPQKMKKKKWKYDFVLAKQMDLCFSLTVHTFVEFQCAVTMHIYPDNNIIHWN